MHKAVRIFKDWMLPIAIGLGISLYLFYRLTPVLKPYGAVLHRVASEGQPLIIAVLMFFQFVQISPHDLRFRRWHLGALAFQIAGFLVFAALSAFTSGGVRLLAECAMICIICPTAAAAGVITRKLDGDLAATVTYLVLVNLVATFLIPMVIPLVRPSSDLGFWAYVLRIARKVFPLLILPGLLAWTIRYTAHGLQRRLFRFAPNSFYFWFFGLTIAMVLASHALYKNYPGGLALTGVVLVSLLTCALQFLAGRRIGRAAAAADVAAAARRTRLAATVAADAADAADASDARHTADRRTGTDSVADRTDAITAGNHRKNDVTTYLTRTDATDHPRTDNDTEDPCRTDAITAGQALGQKNTGFLIWLGYNYLYPVTSVAGGLYAIWQNLFNAWELYEHDHPKPNA